MQAAIFEHFGEPADVLAIRDVSVPEPRTGEVRVRMQASPINPSDLMTIRGKYGVLPTLPAIPGFEGAGIVEKSGGGLLGKYLVGKRVAVLNGRTGNWCESTVVPARQCIPLPRDMPIEQAAMFFVNPATAWLLTRRVLPISQGEWLLQTAAASEVGKMIVRLGRKCGFRTINVVRRAEQADALRELGADATILFDGASQPATALREEVGRITGGRMVQHAIDPVGGQTGTAMAECLSEDGRLVLYGSLVDRPLEVSPRGLISQGAQIEGFWLGRFLSSSGVWDKLRIVRTIKRLLKEGVLTADVAESFPLTEIQQAVRAAEAQGRAGKMLIRMN